MIRKHGKVLATSCEVEIHFSMHTTKFLKCNLRCLQMSGRLITFFTKHDNQVLQVSLEKIKELA